MVVSDRYRPLVYSIHILIKQMIIMQIEFNEQNRELEGIFWLASLGFSMILGSTAENETTALRAENMRLRSIMGVQGITDSGFNATLTKLDEISEKFAKEVTAVKAPADAGLKIESEPMPSA